MELSQITINAHSSIRMDAGPILYFDPYEVTEERKDADVVFLTHDHYDHCSPEDLKKIADPNDPSTIYVMPKSMEESFQSKCGDLAGIIYPVLPDREYKAELKDGRTVPFRTVRAYNETKEFHPKKNDWLGYIVTIDGKDYYVAGDTDKNEDNLKVRADVALVPIGGHFTMDCEEAASLVNAIRPETVIPTHYGLIIGEKSDGEKFKTLVDPSIRVELKLYQE